MSERYRQENVLVCVSYGPNGETLIRRGAKIAAALQATLTILTINPLRDNEYNETKLHYIAEWKGLAAELRAEFVTEESKTRHIADTIVAVAKRRQITHIIMGQSARTRWEVIMKGSISNDILKQLDFIDLHVVAVEREKAHIQDEYEPGVKAYLTPMTHGQELKLGSAPNGEEEGLFFKAYGTDFNNGVFKPFKQSENKYYKIFDGEIKSDISG
ncbi:universal stress protein [Paenibacillus sp. GSMTC-2017]|uniref:universal stress protein n=1 Tax=Paenibacillus sp. GSMTC-2017 TaxID=2794350 RepID=UPI0018D89DF6|nr:universal stress protein [Paenibacillus sp. GSMTC-2017]MBH5320442.1 universal stress protein [Paenibacillus sp. GSMTC-2017]